MYFHISQEGMIPSIPTAGRSTTKTKREDAIRVLMDWAKTLNECEHITIQCCKDE